MAEKKPSSEHALYTSVAVENQKMSDPDRQLRISRIKRQIAVLTLEMNSIRQTIERGGSGGGLFARANGGSGAEEQLALYTTRMETLKQELEILNKQELEEPPVYDAVTTLNKAQTVTSRRNPRAGDDEPKCASGRKVRQMEMAVDFLMDDEAVEDNTMDLQGEIESDIYLPASPSWLESVLVRYSMWLRRKCLQLGLAWGSIQSHMSVKEYNNNKRAVIMKYTLLFSTVALVVLIIQQGLLFSSRRARHQTITERIHKSGISLQTDIETKDSPQYKALDWIAASDPANLDADDKFLLQRYSLAVFWYASNVLDENPVPGIRGSDQLETSWRQSDNWMSEKGICMWFGVQCHHRPGTDIFDTTFDGNDNPTLINITDNRLHGSLPRELFLGSPDIRWVSLSRNELDGTVPSELGTMTQLEYLSLANNLFSGEFDVLPWKQLKRLKRLDLSKNAFAGTLPTDIQELTLLTLLSLYANKLTGPIPGELTKLSRLSALYLDKNGFTGTLPSGLNAMNAITDLRMGNNQIKGKITPFLDSTTMSNLRFLQLEQNLFTGSLPSSLAQLTTLVELRLHGNLLDGTIPTQIGRMHDLESLQLDKNQIEGKIPTELALCLKLKAILLEHNKLESTIPTEITKLKDLAHFRVHNNALTGEIPANIGETWRLESLFLHENKLEGAIPESIGSLHDLKKLRLENNKLVGSVPPSICSLTESVLVEIATDCGGDNPAITCACCTSCIAAAP